MKKKNRRAADLEKRHADGWFLYSGMYEIKWKNGVADEVAIEGVALKIRPWKPRRLRKLFA